MDLRYPIGQFELQGKVTEQQRRQFIKEIEEAPARMRAAVAGLSAAQLDTPYRPGGWTVRQVVHHVPDSHLNAYVRCKLALTEDNPTVKTYDEVRWSELPDVKAAPVETSLRLLESVHERWVLCLKALKPEDFARTFQHPDMGAVDMDRLLAMYAWHGKHHVAHITELRKRQGW